MTIPVTIITEMDVAVLSDFILTEFKMFGKLPPPVCGDSLLSEPCEHEEFVADNRYVR